MPETSSSLRAPGRVAGAGAIAIIVWHTLAAIPALAQAAPASTTSPATTIPAPVAPLSAKPAGPAAIAPAAPAAAVQSPETSAAGTPATATAVPAVERPPVRRIDLLAMVRASDPVVQGVMLFLVLCSAASWAVMIQKSVVLARVARQTRHVSACLRAAADLDELEGRLRPDAGPARAMWAAARREWELSVARIPLPFGADQIGRLLQRLNLAMGSAQERALSRLGDWMGLLATVGATAPFIGLFGTVWGILHSFAQIAATQSTSLAVVAPGIAEALLTTAVGLFAAIPATMFYNRFARAIGQITGALDTVSADLLTLASRDSEGLAR